MNRPVWSPQEISRYVKEVRERAAARKAYIAEDNEALAAMRRHDVITLALVSALGADIPDGSLFGMLYGLNLRPYVFSHRDFHPDYGSPDMRGSYLGPLSGLFLEHMRPLLAHSDAPRDVIIYAAVMSAFDDHGEMMAASTAIDACPWAATLP